MDELHSEVLAQIAGLRRLLADLGDKCSAERLAEVGEGLSSLEVRVRAGISRDASAEESWFREMAEVMPLGVLKLQPDGAVMYANDVALEMFGLGRGDLQAGLSAAQFADQHEFDRLLERMADLARGGAAKPSRYRFRRRDGSLIVIEALGAPAREASGQIWGTIRDVTPEHRAEEVAHARTQLRIGLGTVADLEEAVAMVLDTALLLEGLDSGCVCAFRLEAGAVEVVAARRLSHKCALSIAAYAGSLDLAASAGPDLMSRCALLTREHLRTAAGDGGLEECPRSAAAVPIRHEGRLVALLIVGSHLEGGIPPATCEALGEMAAQVEGTIARMWAEEARQQAVETFEALFRTAPLALYVLDPDGRVLMWNEAAHRVFGWSESEVIGRRPPFVDETNEEDFWKNLQRAMNGPGLQGTEFVRRHKDGRAIDVRISAAALHDAKGRPVGAMAIAEDVSEENRAEETRLRIGRLESLGVLAGGIAHDFNNVLMVIMGNLSLARLEADSEVRAELLGEAQDAAMKAVALTARLVTFAKGGAPAKEVIDLPAIVERVLDRVVGGSAIETEMQLQAELGVEADPVQLREALRCVVTNAGEAMPDGGRLTISTGDHRDPDNSQFVRISVTDTGPGIAPEVVDRIFDPYFSTKTAGAGLGLAGAHSIVTQHGGRIEVRSVPGEGSTFHLYLPATEGSGEVDDSLSEGAPAADLSPCVLVVDDEEMVRSLLVRMLGRLGYPVVACSSGEEAMAVFRDASQDGAPFAAVITDLTMPGGMGGIETAAALHEIDPDAKILVSSGYSDDPAVAHYQDFGFAGSVRKPYSLDALREALDRVSQRRPTPK